MNFLGILGQLGRVLPGYVEGHRAAVADNWKDLQNYNTVQHGQLQNAFDISTYNPLLTREYLNTGNQLFAAMQNGINFYENVAGMPGRLGVTMQNNQNAPALAATNYATQFAGKNAELQNIPLLQSIFQMLATQMNRPVGAPVSTPNAPASPQPTGVNPLSPISEQMMQQTW